MSADPGTPEWLRGRAIRPDRSSQIAADTRTAEIVEMLRAEFQRFSEDSQATDYDLAMRDGWLYAADLIEQRFGAKEQST